MTLLLEKKRNPAAGCVAPIQIRVMPLSPPGTGQKVAGKRHNKHKMKGRPKRNMREDSEAGNGKTSAQSLYSQILN
jgi:hypothetical protein